MNPLCALRALKSNLLLWVGITNGTKLKISCWRKCTKSLFPLFISLLGLTLLPAIANFSAATTTITIAPEHYCLVSGLMYFLELFKIQEEKTWKFLVSNQKKECHSVLKIIDSYKPSNGDWLTIKCGHSSCGSRERFWEGNLKNLRMETVWKVQDPRYSFKRT